MAKERTDERPRSRRRRWLRRAGYVVGAIVVLLLALALDARVAGGKAPHGEHLARIVPSAPAPVKRWWPAGVPWRTAAQYPVKSTHLSPEPAKK